MFPKTLIACVVLAVVTACSPPVARTPAVLDEITSSTPYVNPNGDTFALVQFADGDVALRFVRTESEESRLSLLDKELDRLMELPAPVALTDEGPIRAFHMHGPARPVTFQYGGDFYVWFADRATVVGDTLTAWTP